MRTRWQTKKSQDSERFFLPDIEQEHIVYIDKINYNFISKTTSFSQHGSILIFN